MKPVNSQNPNPARRFGFTWVAMAVVIALHVTDEAATDFLSVYNPAVRAIRARLPFLPLPTFTFGVWLAGRAAGVALLLALSPLAFRQSRWIERVALSCMSCCWQKSGSRARTPRH